jgi:hypothetical protein
LAERIRPRPATYLEIAMNRRKVGAKRT